MSAGFTWRDAGRTVLFREGALADAVAVLGEHGFSGFELFSTPRALADLSPELAAAAATVHEVAPGQVPSLAADLLPEVVVLSAQRKELRPLGEGRPLVAFGGGRVIDVAKAIAAITGGPVAAIPTTMSGAEMTAIHRLPAGAEDRARGMVRPSLILADPELMTGQPEPQLRASSMNALAHGADCLYTPLANPVAEMAALRGAGLIAASLDQGPNDRDRSDLALGSLLCGYAIDSAGLGLHHVVCQTLVRVCGSPHAETNATILPHALAFLAQRAPDPFESLAEALGSTRDALAPRVTELGGNPPGLGALGADRSRIDEAIDAMLTRPELTFVPGQAITRTELAELIAAAW